VCTRSVQGEKIPDPAFFSGEGGPESKCEKRQTPKDAQTKKTLSRNGGLLGGPGTRGLCRTSVRKGLGRERRATFERDFATERPS